MTYDSDDDSLPLITRVNAHPKAPGSDHEDEAADLPAWAKNFQSPYTGGYKPPPLPSSSDDDLLDLTKDSPLPGGHKGAPQAAGPLSQPEPATQPDPQRQKGKAGASTVTPAATSSKPGGKAGAGRGKGRGAGTAGASQVDAPGPSSQAGPSQAAPAAAAAPTAMDIDSPAHEGVELMSQGTQQQEPGSQVQPGATKAKPGGRGRGAGAASLLPPGAELPIMLPEKLPRNKYLVELAAGDHEEAVDLAGDAGAVGRVIVTGQGESAEMTLDLKGVMFQASVLPLQGTALVINVQPSEARVEAVLNDFIRLTDQGGAWGLDEEGGGGLAALLGSDDEDHYALTQGEGGGEGEEAGAKKKKSTSKKAAGKGEAKPKGKGKAPGVKAGAVKKTKKATGPKKAAGAKKGSAKKK